MSVDNLDAWNVDNLPFPHNRGLAEQLQFLLRFAILAPSGHNVQPWRFHIEGTTLEMRSDPSRALPCADPLDRELHISCGAALENLGLAMRHFGRGTILELLPDANQPQLLARLTPGPPCHPSALEEILFRAIPDRHTYRGPFDSTPIAGPLREHLIEAALFHGLDARLISDDHKEPVANLVAEGDRLLNADPHYRHELSRWMRTNFSHQPDGIPAYSLGLGDTLSLLAPFFVYACNQGESLARDDREKLLSAPLALVLCSPSDDPKGWLQTGRGLQRLWLTAVSGGLQASFLNQPIQVPSLRQQLRELLDTSGHPQLLLRLGYPDPKRDPRPTPRRPIADVTE